MTYSLTQHCATRKIKVKLTEAKYKELYSEYYDKLRQKGISWKKEVEACVDWCYDNGKKSINANSIRNRMRKALEFCKDKEIRERGKKLDEVQKKNETNQYDVKKIQAVKDQPRIVEKWMNQNGTEFAGKLAEAKKILYAKHPGLRIISPKILNGLAKAHIRLSNPTKSC